VYILSLRHTRDLNQIVCYPWVIQGPTNPSYISLHPGSETLVFLGERACPQAKQATAYQWYCQQTAGCSVWTPVNNPYHYLHCITPRVLLLPLPLTETFPHSNIKCRNNPVNEVNIKYEWVFIHPLDVISTFNIHFRKTELTIIRPRPKWSEYRKWIKTSHKAISPRSHCGHTQFKQRIGVAITFTRQDIAST